MSLKKAGISTVRTACLAGMLFLFWGCSNDQKAVEALAQSFDGAVVEQRGFRAAVSQGGRQQFTVRAKRMEQFTKAEVPYVRYYDVVVQMKKTPGKRGAWMKAEQVVQRPGQQVWLADGRVVVQNQDGNRLETESIVWDAQTGRIFGERAVRLTASSQILTGTGFEADDRLETYTLFNAAGQMDSNNK